MNSSDKQNDSISDSRLLSHESRTTDLLKEQQAAEILGLKPGTIRNSRHTGMLAGVDAPPFLKMGRTIRYRLEDVLAWRDQFTARTCTRDEVTS